MVNGATQAAAEAASIKLILDTNIVLDGWLFDDPRVSWFRSGAANHRVSALRSPLALNELRRVLAYPKLRLQNEKQAQVLEQYERDSEAANLPAGFSAEHLLLPSGFPRCRDRDDQHFLALAFHAQAYALITRDRAVLSLQSRAARFGVRILGVEQIAAEMVRT